MLDNGYLYAINNKRIFINVSIGCRGNCSYCYLPKIGYSNKEIVKSTKTAEEIIETINSSNINFNKNTLITIGCYSECFDDFNKEETIKIIKYFLNKGNQVQVSTKKEIKFVDIEEILPLIKYRGQFILFVSSSTISMHGTIEKNTDKPEMRFKNFEYDKYFPTVLYMKPVLKDITYNDLDLYKNIISKYNIKYVVVGSIFTEKLSSETVHFSNDNKLFYNEIDDEIKIINELKDICNVYRRSTEIVRLFKKVEL